MKYTYEGRKGNVQCEPGKFILRVIDAEEKLSTQGNDMIVVDYINAAGAKARDNLVFTEKAAWKVDTFLASAGKAPEEGQEVDLSASGIIGWTVYADVGRNEKGYAEINAYLERDNIPMAGPMPPEVEEAKAAEESAFDDVPF